MRPVNYETKNLFANFSVWSERLRRAGALPAGVALAVLFALSAPSAQAKVEKITIDAIDDVVAGDEGWIIAIDDVAADAGGWITAIDGAVGAGGGIAAYAAGAGGGFAAFGDITDEIGGGIAAFGQVEVEAKVYDKNGKELFPQDFSIENKTPDSKPDERTTDFPSSKDTPTITDDPVDETGFISFATRETLFAGEGSTAMVEIFLTKPAPVGGIRLSFTIDGTAHAHADVEFESSSVFVPEGEMKAVIPIRILDDAEHELDETLVLSWYNNNLPYGWELDNNDTHTLTIAENDAPNYPEDKTLVVDEPDEEPATDITAINPNGEPPSSDKTPRSKPDERTVEFPSSRDTPTITNDLIDEIGYVHFAELETSSVVEGGMAIVEVRLSKPAPEGGFYVLFTVDEASDINIDEDGDIVKINKFFYKVIVPEGATNVAIPIAILNDTDPESNETITFELEDWALPNGWELGGDRYHEIIIVENDGFIEDEGISVVNNGYIHNQSYGIFRYYDRTGRVSITNSAYAKISGVDNAIRVIRKEGDNDIDITNDGDIWRADDGIYVRFEGTADINITNNGWIWGVEHSAIEANYEEGEGDINITNNGWIWSVETAIKASHNGKGNINIFNNDRIWGVKKYGIYAEHGGTGKINVVAAENIRLSEDGQSDIYMVGGDQHNLTLLSNIVLANVSIGVENDILESKWDLHNNGFQRTFEGYVDNGAYRYVLDHQFVEGENKWSFYRVLTPTAATISDELRNLAAIRADNISIRDGGFWAHQNSLHSSDDSVHFGFKTPVMNFIDGNLSINNNIAPNLSASLVEGMSMSSSIGLDYHFDVMGLSVSPQMELAWTRFDFDDFTGPGNTGTVSLEDGDIITGRLGFLFDGDYIYGGINLHTPIDGTTSVNISGVSIASEQDDFSVDGLLGFSYDWSEDYETYGELFMDADEVRANLGVRIDF